MTPGTSESAARLRAIAANLDAEQARLGRDNDKTSGRLDSRRYEDTAAQRPGSAVDRSSTI